MKSVLKGISPLLLVSLLACQEQQIEIPAPEPTLPETPPPVSHPISHKVVVVQTLGADGSNYVTYVSHGRSVEKRFRALTGFYVEDIVGCDGSFNGDYYTTGPIVQDCTIHVNFQRYQYDISTDVAPEGVISPSSSQVLFGHVRQFEITPDPGFAIESVSGCNGNLDGNIYSNGLITNSCTISVQFEPLYKLTVNKNNGGIVYPEVAEAIGGESVSFEIKPEPFHVLSSISGCQGEVWQNNQYRVPKVTEDCEIQVEFSELKQLLNDTGQISCVYGPWKGRDCPAPHHPGQDAEHGRDALALAGLLTKSEYGGGNAGFDFTKISAEGDLLTVNATDHSCVQDNHTGLMWEVKTDDWLLHDYRHSYSWYDPNNSVEGNSLGMANGGKCSGSDCDTHAFVEAVNAAGLCGYHDWRMPSLIELQSIVDYGRVDPAIDTDFFGLTLPYGYVSATVYGFYWSSNIMPRRPSSRRGSVVPSGIYFGSGEAKESSPNRQASVRLVRTTD